MTTHGSGGGGRPVVVKCVVTFVHASLIISLIVTVYVGPLAKLMAGEYKMVPMKIAKSGMLIILKYLLAAQTQTYSGTTCE